MKGQNTTPSPKTISFTPEWYEGVRLRAVFRQQLLKSHQHCGILGAIRRFRREKDKKLGKTPSQPYKALIYLLWTLKTVFSDTIPKTRGTHVAAIKKLWASLNNFTKMITIGGEAKRRCRLSKRRWNLWLHVGQCRWPRQNAGAEAEWLRKGKRANTPKPELKSWDGCLLQWVSS